MADKTVQNGNEVEISYTGKLEDGTVFDTTESRGPFKFTAGSENIIQGMNDAVIGMEIGEEKTVELQPDEAYGQYNENLLVKVERSRMPDEVQVGDALTDGNNTQTWYVRELNEEHGVLDGNHPLAGEKLIFQVKVENVE